MVTDIGSALSGLIAFATVLMGARYLVSPRPAAAGFGIPGDFAETGPGPAWLAVKATRDIAIGIIIAILLISGHPRLLAWLMLAVASIPLADGAIVLRSGGPKAVAYGVHWATAAVMVVGSVLLIG
jgi:hypothetical protein